MIQKDIYKDFDTDRLSRVLFQLTLSFSYAVDAKDVYTNGHSMRVADYTREIAKHAGMTLQEQKELYMAGLLHDIGKIGIPDSILNKTSKLTDVEFNTIKSHVKIGADILDNITEFPFLAIGARYHHERFDGKGYLLGLSGENIPQYARIICVADAYDAMTSNRSYRVICDQSYVREEFEKGKGKQFDPEYADIMLWMIDQDVNYTMHG